MLIIENLGNTGKNDEENEIHLPWCICTLEPPDRALPGMLSLRKLIIQLGESILPESRSQGLRWVSEETLHLCIQYKLYK